ncbi:MAG: double zinc ribbon domain-containing protein [Solirubrobacterales bacterium]
MLFALFGIGNDALNLVVNLLVLTLVVVYFALVAWTFFDARRRMEDPVLVASAVGASFVFPFIGTVIYSILRPPEFLEDAREREVEIKAAELRVKQLTEQSCPKCEYPVEKSYLRCPNCRARLKDPCTSCGKPVDPRWALCPYCETPLQKPERRVEKPERKAREPQPTREQRRPAAAGSRGGSSKRSKRQGDQQRRKGGSSGGRRAPARSAAAEKSEQREGKQDAGPRQAGSTGEERPRPATAS